MAFLPAALGPALLDPEIITLTTTDDTAVQNNFSVITADTLRDVLIQNDSASKAYVIWGTSAVTATNNHAILAANGNIALENVNYTYFSVIRVTGGSNVTVHIVGIG
jgi:hypothetical protein